MPLLFMNAVPSIVSKARKKNAFFYAYHWSSLWAPLDLRQRAAKDIAKVSPHSYHTNI